MAGDWTWKAFDQGCVAYNRPTDQTSVYLDIDIAAGNPSYFPQANHARFLCLHENITEYLRKVKCQTTGCFNPFVGHSV
jgi:hypothetical protein